MPLAIGALALGIGSTLMGASAQKKAARQAAAEAKKQREWYELKARETKRTLGREIETMKTLRSLDLPVYQQAAKVAAVQRAKGYESAMRSKMQRMGRLPEDYRNAMYGQNLNAYLGREGEKLQRYATMTQGIFGAASKMQEQVNSLLGQGGAQYSSLMKTSLAMDFEAGSGAGKAMGAAAQGLSMMSQQQAAQQAQQQSMKGAFGLEAFGQHVAGGGDLASFKEQYAPTVGPDGKPVGPFDFLAEWFGGYKK